MVVTKPETSQVSNVTNAFYLKVIYMMTLRIEVIICLMNAFVRNTSI